MASDKQSPEPELRYVVYLPHNERAVCYPIRIRRNKEVQELTNAICEHRAFKRHVESEDVYLYNCGELDIVPPGSNASQVRYQKAMEWIRRHSPMEPTFLLPEYSSSVPVHYEEKKIDVIIATESILKSIFPKVNYAIILDSGNISTGELQVELGIARPVSNLRQKIYNRHPTLFSPDRIDEASLFLYKPSGTIQKSTSNLLERMKHNAMQQLVIDGKIEEGLRELLENADLLHLVITLKRWEGGPGIIPYGPNKWINYEEHVTFKINVGGLNSGAYHWDSVADLNGYEIVTGSLPDFIKAVVERPRRVASETMSSDLQEAFKNTLAKLFRDGDSVDSNVERLLSDDAAAVPYSPEHFEICHYIHALDRVNAKVLKPNISMEQANEVIFNNLMTFWKSQGEDREWKLGCDFPFILVAATWDEVVKETEKRKYRPRPDFALLKHNFPRFLVEFDSKKNREDNCWLQVQLACSLRLALALLNAENSTKDKNDNDEKRNVNEFFLMGAFFTKESSVVRYFVYTDKAGKIYLHKALFSIDDASQLTTFLFEFYNYARNIKDEGIELRADDKVINASNQVGGQIGRSVCSKRTSRPGADQDGAGSHPSKRTKQGKNEQADMIETLQESGYDLSKSDGFESYYKLSDRVVEATAPGAIPVIVKRSSRFERDVLRELSSRKSKHNHVIRLLDSIESNVGPLIVLERGRCLSVIGDMFEDRSVRMSQQLIEGVAFLHRQKIAHLDIKPANIIYNFKDELLSIIDFDLAMWCNDVEEMVEIRCGTEGWSAPEIILDEKEPVRAFSPIRADLWSCGKVLRFIAERTKTASKNEGSSDFERLRDFKQLSKKLMVDVPRRRPLLHEVVGEESTFWACRQLLRALKREHNGDEVQETMLGGIQLKRPRGDADCRMN